MLVKFNTKDSKITGNDLSIMEHKIQRRFHRYFSNEAEEATVLAVKIADKKFRYKVELTLPYLGYQLRTETYDDVSPIAALDKSMDAMDSQILKCKTKVSKIKHQTIDLSQVSVSAAADDSDDDNFEIVRTKRYEMKPMTVQEAIMNMNMLGHTFYMFQNRDTNKISTVYKRDESNYGLIEPM